MSTTSSVRTFVSLSITITILSSAILALLRFNSFRIGTYVDDAHYIVLSKSLATGHGYHLINFPSNPIEWAFPPGLPLMLAPSWSVAADNYSLLQMLPLICWLGSVALVCILLWRTLPFHLLVVVAALTSVNPSAIGLSVMVMSETPYLFFSLLSLVLFHMWTTHSQPASLRSVSLLGLAIIAAAWAQLIRSVGVVLIFALLLELLLQRKFRAFLFGLGTALLTYLIQLWINAQLDISYMSSSYSSILDYGVVEGFQHLVSNLSGYILAPNALISNIVLPILGPNVINILSTRGLGMVAHAYAYLFPVLVVLGYIIVFQKMRVVALYCFFYGGAILLFWHENRAENTDVRYLLPILPFIYWYVIEAVMYILTRLVRLSVNQSYKVLYPIVLMLLLVLIGRNLQDWRNPIRYRLPDVSAGATWIQRNTSVDSVIMVPAAVPAYLYMQRQTVNYPASGNKLWNEIKKWSVDYVVVSQNIGRDMLLPVEELQAMLRQHTTDAKVVYRDQQQAFTIYQIVQ